MFRIYQIYSDNSKCASGFVFENYDEAVLRAMQMTSEYFLQRGKPMQHIVLSNSYEGKSYSKLIESIDIISEELTNIEADSPGLSEELEDELGNKTGIKDSVYVLRVVAQILKQKK